MSKSEELKQIGILQKEAIESARQIEELESKKKDLIGLLKEANEALGSYLSGLQFSQMSEDINYITTLREEIQKVINPT